MISTSLHAPTIRRLTATLFVSQAFALAARVTAFNVAVITAVALAGNDESVAGFPGTLGLIGSALAAYPAGRLMARFGRRIGLSAGYLIGLIGGAVTSLGVIAGSLLLFVLGWYLLGTARVMYEQSRYAAADIAPEHRRGKTISIIVFAGTIGAICGPLLTPFAGNVAEALGYDSLVGPGALAGILFVVSFIITFFFLRPDPHDLASQINPRRDAPQHAGGGRSFVQVMSVPSARLALISLGLAQTVMVMLMTITPVHMGHFQHGLDSISLVLSAHVVGMFGLSMVVGWFADRFGRRATIGLGSLILILACIIAPQNSDTLPLAISLFLLGLGWNMCYVAGSALLTDMLAPHECARIQGASDFVVMFASAIGSLSSGPLLAANGFASVAWIGAGLSLIVIAVTLKLHPARPAMVIEQTS